MRLATVSYYDSCVVDVHRDSIRRGVTLSEEELSCSLLTVVVLRQAFSFGRFMASFLMRERSVLG